MSKQPRLWWRAVFWTALVCQQTKLWTEVHWLLKAMISCCALLLTFSTPSVHNLSMFQTNTVKSGELYLYSQWQKLFCSLPTELWALGCQKPVWFYHFGLKTFSLLGFVLLVFLYIILTPVKGDKFGKGSLKIITFNTKLLGTGIVWVWFRILSFLVLLNFFY